LCFIKKGDGDIFYEQLQQLNDFVKKEWVEGNQPEDFKEIDSNYIRQRQLSQAPGCSR